MSSLWKAWVDHDVDRFRRLLAPAGYGAQGASKSPHIGTGGPGGSPGAFGTSPRIATKMRKGSGLGPGGGGGPGGRSGNTNFGRAEVNSRDHAGLTILLRASSSTSEDAIAFVETLLNHPAIDLHVQDPESGWNALHRALYAGNISIARLLLEKERRDLTGQTVGASLSRAGRLIRTKDHEGLSPFDLYNSTIAQRDVAGVKVGRDSDDESEDEETGDPRASESTGSLFGSELFAFGSNKNLTLGLGDEDDRQFPERVYLQRSDYLLQRFHNEYLRDANSDLSVSANCSLDEMPTLTRFRDLEVQDVQLSKYHSAILTTDPVSNLYVCGVGRGGRLGLGDENTRFNYTPVQGGLVNKKVVQVALGQNHTMAITDTGELWNWGTNANSVLGYSLPDPVNKGEEPFIATPRQVFGPLKKEVITGIAASTIHSVAYNGSALFCWGKNVGQLALMDADSRSLEVQTTPRRVAASLISAPIVMASAIDKATTCLLANQVVIVFTAYGYNIVKFPYADALANYNLGGFTVSFSGHDSQRTRIKHIASGGETIVALTGRGDLFHMNLLAPKADAHSSSSTTNPTKIKNAVSQPVCIWTAHKDGVRSVDVGEHGSVIISTESGAVWRRIKRAKAKDSIVAGVGDAKHKDFKFQRVPGITDIVAVRSSVFGAFAAVRKDSEVIREQIKTSPPTLWDDLAPLDYLKNFRSSDASTQKKDNLKFWNHDQLVSQLASTALEVLKSPDLDADLHNYLSTWPFSNEELDTAVCTSSSPEIRLPVHSWILGARSPVLRRGLPTARLQGSYELPEHLTIESVAGKTTVTFTGIDIISLLNLVLFMYEDRVIPVWNYTRQDPALAYRYRQIRTEVMKLAARLEMSKLEAAAQKQTDPLRSMHIDFRSALDDPTFFDDADAILLLDGDEVPAHSALLRQRCPFFEALFHGRSQGAWLANRRAVVGPAGMIPIDLEHIEPETFKYVLRYLYADVGTELFNDVICDSIDDFSDLVMDVMGVANELMLDRLSQICQQVISRFVNTRNVAHYLNAISPCSVTAFKDAGLEYITLQAENLLENNLLENLDDEVIEELDAVVRANQLARYPFARSDRAELLLHENHPELAQDIEEERQRRVREMAFKASQKEEERKLSSSLRGKFGSLEDLTPVSPGPEKQARKAKARRNEPFSPELRPKSTQNDFMFDMDDEEGTADSPSIRPQKIAGGKRQQQPELDQIPPLAGSSSYLDERRKSIAQSPLMPSPAAVATAPEKFGTPWASATMPTTKLDLREIMNEGSSGPSALSAGLAAQRAKEASAKPQQTKISQKERKRQQQLQAEQAAREALTPPAKTPWEKSSADTKASPWKTVSRDAQPSPKGTMPDALLQVPPNTKPLVAAEASAKSIPRRTQSPDTRHSGQSRTPTTATPPLRPPSKPTAPSSMSTFSADDPSKPIVPHSKSYMKPASKSEPTLGLSMADIMDQETRNRDKVKEAVAKRSLMEIQQEQAFQEWWDEESRRTQEEEARRLAREKDREEGKSRGRRGRGGKARASARGGGGGGPSGHDVGAKNTGPAGGETARQAAQEAGRSRGNRRGRGRGGVAKASS
ncbi:hypothetical protein M406DRAFT_347904 [Cryphonectria parasitica EP155]|uniref:BTB domain-containing protein n=1 Tax=Cryphonectria parasitica (strain ATCC 38755 / EP155) TaxID=660469 RepID=A0A9P5CKV3_CRYP1|nr:uncharacterized protein M406DRAFT_347904 [Cryphonectria parasitica EP155]KAF3761552.1 hypothetical protein M406DRAFT_347904 [Cryphonectria parasitica EP155]